MLTILTVVVFGVLVLNCFASNAQLLPQQEVETLKIISEKLKNTFWSIDRSSCGSAQWNNSIKSNQIISNVTCNCTYNNNTVCHVTNFELKGFNLTGVVPPELGNLTYLEEIGLTRNYLNGTIPISIAQLPNLRSLSLLGNRLSGPIPSEIGNVHTLEELILEDNLFGGPLPPNLGNLRNLRRLLLAANNFSGTIPDEYGNLKNLTIFRIDGTTLSGRLPEFIGNWTNMNSLDLQGTSMEGPIPSSISQLKNMQYLKITDLGGSTSNFPNLQEMSKLHTLVLRNCSIIGSIPDYIGQITTLNTLDLSFNRLTGKIPDSIRGLNAMNFMFLTANSLNGALPNWLLQHKQSLDLSYNNFTGSVSTTCHYQRVNLVSSHSSSTNNSEIPWCLNHDLPCPSKSKYHSLFINCGGPRTTVDGNEYVEDLIQEGTSTFASVSDRWGYSSTGLFMGNAETNYITGNTFNLNVTGPEFYRTARLSPQSLKYYGFCMKQGSYKVQLHFAEIMYSNGQKFSSLGRRIFDVYIQGNLVLKDFNIMDEAGGAGIGIIKAFDNVYVNGSTLEIHLYWAGKGTNAIPSRGVYGPLISAITVTPNFKVDT